MENIVAVVAEPMAEPVTIAEEPKKLTTSDKNYYINWYHEHKTLITCDCGSTLYKQKLWRHVKSQKHIKFLESQKNNNNN